MQNLLKEKNITMRKPERRGTKDYSLVLLISNPFRNNNQKTK